MLVTGLGWILIPTAILLFFLAPRWLHILTVFFVPFSATAVANFPAGASGSGLQAWMFCGGLWVARSVLNRVYVGHLSLPRRLLPSATLALLFLLAVIASLFMPGLIDGRLEIESPILFDDTKIPVTFGSNNVTQALYLTFGLIIAFLVAKKSVGRLQLVSMIKIYTLSASFVSIWAVFQWFCFQIQMPYPDFIFNNSINESAHGYNTLLFDGEITRLSSVAVEPSIFAQYLLTSLPFVWFAAYFREPLFSIIIDRLILMLIVVVLLLTTASTAYIGIAITLFIAGIVIFLCHEISRRFFIFSIFALLVISAAIFLVPSISQLVIEQTINKGDSYSGLERLNAMIKAWNYFTAYPVLGIGWGNVTSHDLALKLLADTGIIGASFFLLMILFVLNRAWKMLKVYHNRGNAKIELSLASGAITSFITMLLINAISGFAFVFGHFWVIFGFVIALPLLGKNSSSPLHQLGSGVRNKGWVA